MSTKERIPIFPSRGAQMQMKARLAGAHKGHGLLKKKADALQMRFRMILSKIIETKTLMGDVMKEAAFSLAEAKFATGDFNQVVLQNVTKAQIKIRTKKDNVAGVTLPVFESYQDGTDTYELAGLARGGQQLQKLKKNYQAAVKLLVELASLQTSFVTLDEVIKITNRRVNAIEHENTTCDHQQDKMYRPFLLLLYLLHGCCSTRPPPNKLVGIKTNCTKDSLRVKVDLGKPFKGIVFAKDFSEECRARGNYTSSVELTIPLSGCGVRAEPKDDEGMEMSVKIVVQMDGKLRQVADVVKLARCLMPSDMMDMDLQGLDRKNVRNGRMRFEAESEVQRVRVWLELGGNGGAGAVEVGQATTLGVRALLPRSIGVRVVDCAALDGLGESSQKLLDDRGCPIDEQVMPALLIRLRPTEEGWSKPHEDDLVEKLFTATFPAFKFPDRERLHVSCGVQLCKGPCPRVDCKTQEPFILPNEKQLARIEVFNSLAVTAPQIELERLQMQKRTNESGNEASVTARHIKSEGTLCMSSSKLALAFCLLGMVFLIAVIVAVVCLLRARVTKARSIRTTGTSIFSTSSSSQSRFGSKLFVPYAGGTLPYGRVY